MRAIILTLRAAASLTLIALATPFLWATLSGDYFMTVTGESMKPTYEIGDVLVVEAPKGDELQFLDTVVIVSPEVGERTDQYVHRVVELVDEGAVLKGDGNQINDPFPVTQEQVLGTPRIALQGSWATLFRFSGLWAVRAIVGVVFLVVLFVPSRGKAASRGQLHTDKPAGGTSTIEPAAASASFVDSSAAQ